MPTQTQYRGVSMKNAKHSVSALLLTLSLALCSFAVPHVEGSESSLDPVMLKLLSHPDVLQKMHTMVTRHAGVLQGISEIYRDAHNQVYPTVIYGFTYVGPEAAETPSDEDGVGYFTAKVGLGPLPDSIEIQEVSEITLVGDE